MIKKQILTISLLAFALVGLGIGTALFSQRRIVQQRAAFGSLNIRLDPASQSKAVGEEFELAIKIEAGGFKVSGFDLKLDFDKTKLEIVNFIPNTEAFNLDLTANNASLLGATTGQARLMAANSGASLPTGNFTAGTLKLKGKIISGASPTTLTINKAVSQVVGQNTGDDVVLSIDQTTNGSFTISAEEVDVGAPILNFKVKFQGINQKRADQKVQITVVKGSFKKVFSGVNIVSDESGVYSGKVSLTGVALGDGYAVFVKGPKHLARKFCVNNQESRCTQSGSLTLSSGENIFNFSKLILEGGDLPNPNDAGRQDGVVNSVDYSLINSGLGKSLPEILAYCDINLDGACNVTDRLLVRNTLETKFEDDH